MTAPLYRQLAERLRSAIASGRYPVGDQLPPELELCETYDCSRHTVREAVRILQDAGLIERRRGAGTTVIANGTPRYFVQPLGGIDMLLQYARDAQLSVQNNNKRRLNAAETTRLGIKDDRAWLVIDGLRRAKTTPVALVRIFIAPEFARIGPKIAFFAGAVQELIAERYGKSPARIQQDISAEILAPGQARRLHAQSGAAALRTLRRYYGTDDNLMLASDSVHPADRFIYTMRYQREN
jgi:GntR family transcriptional regulator